MSEDFEQVRELFLKAVSLNSDEARECYLSKACGGDSALRSKVDHLLRNDPELGSFLDGPVVDVGKGEQTTADSISHTEKEGDRIGRYKLLQKVGEGGMGVVYMAEQTEPVTRKVALKIIKLGMDTKRVVARFEAERQALAMMDHPNIARVLDGGATQTGRPYFVMELVQGISITDFAKKNKLAIGDRLDLFIQVCRAIQSAHQKGIIHRDIKPSNVMVSLHHGEPMIKVIDFGIVKAINQKLTEKTLFTDYAQIIGTPAYMSPEQAEMSTIDVDTRTDIYSLGTLLYELLTGTTPFPERRLRSAGYGEMQRIIAEEDPENPSTRMSTFVGEQKNSLLRSHGSDVSALGNQLKGDLDWITMKCLEKDRRLRYDTPNELSADLERYLNSEPVSAAAPTLRYQLQKLYRKHSLFVHAAALVSALLIVTAVFSTYQAVRATRAENRANHEAELARTQAAIAQAVNDFLNDDLLGQADPTVQPDRDVTLRTVLDRAAESIEGRFVDQPLVEASIRFTIGQAYHRLTEIDLATPHINKSLEIRKRELGIDALETLESEIESIYLINNSYLRRSGADDATLLLEKRARVALEVSLETFGADASITLSIKELLSILFRKNQKWSAAEEALKDILEHRQRRLGDDHLDTLNAMYELAELYYYSSPNGHEEKAKQLIHEARERFENRMDSDTNSGFVLKLLWFEASLLSSSRQFKQALENNEKLVELCTRRYGQDHAITLNCMQNRGGLFLSLNEIDKAIEIRREIVRRYSETYGEVSGGTLGSIGWLFGTYWEGRRFQEAESLLKTTLEALHEQEGEKPREYHNIVSHLVNLYLWLGKTKQAVEVYENEYGMGLPSGDSSTLKLNLVRNVLCSLGHLGHREKFETLSRAAGDYSRRLTREKPPEAPGEYEAMAQVVRLVEGYDQALDSYRLMTDRLPNEENAWLSRSVFEALGGNRKEFEECCLKLLEMAQTELDKDPSRSHRIVGRALKTCLLVPGLSPLIESQAARLYESLEEQLSQLRSDRKRYPWILQTLALQDFRSGQHDEVVNRLSTFQVDNYSPSFESNIGFGILLVVHAMSEFELGHQESARGLLEKAATSARHFLPNGLDSDLRFVSRQESLRYYILRQEAESLILGRKN